MYTAVIHPLGDPYADEMLKHLLKITTVYLRLPVQFDLQITLFARIIYICIYKASFWNSLLGILKELPLKLHSEV